MDGHRLPSQTLPVLFLASGRGSRKLPPSAAPAGLSFRQLQNKHGLMAALWSVGLGLAAAWLGPDRFNTMRFAATFFTAALAHLLFDGRASTSNPGKTRS
jgi:hypothetical protein